MLQMGPLVVSLKGTELLENERALIRHKMTAGIILFTRNYKPNDIESLKALIADIQNIAIDSGKENGLPIFIDQEGGYVQRFGRGFTALPSPEVFGTAYDLHAETGLQLAYHYGNVMAKELSAIGVISLCPVLDIKAGNSVIGGLNRAFHSDPSHCSKLAEAYIDGMNAAGMKATGKHFPGHGQDVGDSHEVKPKDERTLLELESYDLRPFTDLIKKNKLGAIMPAHITYTKVDPEQTAGMSKIWLQDLLRDKYGYKGVIISDCLSMKGAGDDSYLEKTKKALEFGDIALLCNLEPEVLLEVLNGLDASFYLTPDANDRFQAWVGGSIAARLTLAKLYNKKPPEEEFNFNAFMPAKDLAALQDKIEESKDEQKLQKSGKAFLGRV